MTWQNQGWQWLCWAPDHHECDFSHGGFEDDGLWVVGFLLFAVVFTVAGYPWGF